LKEIAMTRRVVIGSIVGFIFIATACTTTQQVTLPPPGSTAAQRLFVGNLSANNVLIFSPPFSSASTPSSLLSTNALGVGLDSTGILAVVSSGDVITVYAAGATSASTPYATFTGSGSSGGLDSFAASGKLAAPNQTKVDIFTPPFSNASTPSLTISGFTQPIGSAFDGSGNLYIVDIAGGGAGSVSVLAPPYTGAPVTTTNGLVGQAPYGVVAIGSQLFVAACNSGTIRAYALPLTTGEASSFSIASGGVCPIGLAADAAGNLYALNHNPPANLVIFNPPFSASSLPAVTIPASYGIVGPYGIALGK
jgi:hypothetical protein